MGNVCERRAPSGCTSSCAKEASRPQSRLLRQHDEATACAAQVTPPCDADPLPRNSAACSTADPPQRSSATSASAPSPENSAARATPPATAENTAEEKARHEPRAEQSLAEVAQEINDQDSVARQAAFRALVTSADVAAIELVLRVARDHLRQSSASQRKAIRLDAVQRRTSKDGFTCALTALQAAGFASTSQADSQLELSADASQVPLRELVRMIERTRGTYWTPTPLPKEEEPDPDPDDWRIMVSPDIGGYVIKEADVELWSQTFRRTGNEARTWRGGHTPRVTVTFMNMSPSERLLINWIDSRSLNPTEDSRGEVGPASHVEQWTFVNHAWVLRLPSGAAVAGYVPTEPGPGAHHVVVVGRHRSMPSQSKFEEMAQRHVQAIHDKAHGWRDTAANAESLTQHGASLPPRPANEQWAVAAWPPYSGMEVAEADADVWSGTHRSVGMEGRNWRGAQTQKVQLIFVNCSRERVGVSWLDIHNNMRERWDYYVEPGESKPQGTYICHAFVFRDSQGRAVGGYVPMNVAEADRHIVFFGPRDALPQGDNLRRRAESIV